MLHLLYVLWASTVVVNFIFILIYLARLAPQVVAAIRQGRNELVAFGGVVVIFCMLGIFAILLGPLFSVVTWTYLSKTK